VSRASVDAGVEIAEREEERCRVRTKAGVEDVELGGCMYEVRRRTSNRIEGGLEWASTSGVGEGVLAVRSRPKQGRMKKDWGREMVSRGGAYEGRRREGGVALLVEERERAGRGEAAIRGRRRRVFPRRFNHLLQLTILPFFAHPLLSHPAPNPNPTHTANFTRSDHPDPRSNPSLTT
jgi:hypothetical protein